MPHNLPLLPYEGDILLWINAHHSPVLDAFMYSISNPIVWIPLVVVLLYYIFAHKPWQEGALLIICLILCLGVGHLVGNVWAKDFFARPRPTFTEGFMEQLHLVYGYTGRSFSFFSGHATNFFAAATLLSYAVGRRAHTIILYTVVAIVAYSRMYQGVHFLSDILAGIVVGLAIGYLFAQLYRRLRSRLLSTRSSSEVFTKGYPLWLGGLAAFVPILLVFSLQVAHILERLAAK